MSKTKCGKDVLSHLRVGIHLEHQNAYTKRMKGVDISASVAWSPMACRGRYRGTNFELNYIQYMSCHS